MQEQISSGLVSHKLLAVGFVVVAIAIALFAFKYFIWGKDVSDKQTNSTEAVPKSETWEATPENISIPEAGEKNVPDNVAVPEVVGPAGNNTEANFRRFEISVKDGRFEPNTIVVRKGDTIHAVFNAKDKNYDFTQPDYGLKMVLPQGEEKIVEWSASAAGKFTFFCESCGGPDKGPVGYVIVAE